MKIGIYGYGNIGKGVELAASQNKDVEVVGIFTRRNPSDIKSLCGTKVYNASDIFNFKNEIDVLIICGGSATELPTMTVELAKNFNVVDSFDNHSHVYEHFNNVNKEALGTKHTALISCGWDPGMFSLNRLYAGVVLPEGKDYTFWGRGISQGHSDAIRHIEGVIDARQYTVPVDEVVERIKNGDTSDYTVREKHKRECFVVAEENADKNKIENEIKTMPGYFADYDTTVHFITLDELKKNHSEMAHGGFVIRTGVTGINKEHKHTISYNLKLDSNPEFTASCLIAFARAVDKMHKRGEVGAKTVLDVRPRDLSALSDEDILKHII